MLINGFGLKEKGTTLRFVAAMFLIDKTIPCDLLYENKGITLMFSIWLGAFHLLIKFVLLTSVISVMTPLE